MAVPAFSDFHQPVLKYLYENDVMTQKELMRALIGYFSLNETDIRETVPSGLTVL